MNPLCVTFAPPVYTSIGRENLKILLTLDLITN